jgi:hypothetical protein
VFTARGQFEIAVQPSIWPGQLTLPITPSPRRSGRMYRAIQFVGALVHSEGAYAEIGCCWYVTARVTDAWSRCVVIVVEWTSTF